MCICSSKGSQRGGYSPGWCKPRSPGEDSEGAPRPPGPPLAAAWARAVTGIGRAGETRLRLQRHPQERMMEREECGFSAFSSCQNNSKKANSFKCRENFLPWKGRSCPSHLADPSEEEMRSKTNPFSGNRTQEPKLFTARHGATHSLVFTQRLAHSRRSQNCRKVS